MPILMNDKASTSRIKERRSKLKFKINKEALKI
jgi:hypothetical protein